MIIFTRRASRGIHLVTQGTENDIYFIISPGWGSGLAVGIARLYWTFHDLLMELVVLPMYHAATNPQITTMAMNTDRSGSQLCACMNCLWQSVTGVQLGLNGGEL